MKLLTTVVLAFAALDHLGFLVIGKFRRGCCLERKAAEMTPAVSVSPASVFGGVAMNGSIEFTQAIPAKIGPALGPLALEPTPA